MVIITCCLGCRCVSFIIVCITVIGVTVIDVSCYYQYLCHYYDANNNKDIDSSNNDIDDNDEKKEYVNTDKYYYTFLIVKTLIITIITTFIIMVTVIKKIPITDNDSSVSSRSNDSNSIGSGCTKNKMPCTI